VVVKEFDALAPVVLEHAQMAMAYLASCQALACETSLLEMVAALELSTCYQPLAVDGVHQNEQRQLHALQVHLLPVALASVLEEMYYNLYHEPDLCQTVDLVPVDYQNWIVTIRHGEMLA
jgi:hypothetical protein